MGVSKAPPRMRVVAWLCVLLGAIALGRSLVQLNRGVVGFDPVVLLLPAGIALLLGWVRFRMWISVYVAYVATLAIAGISFLLAGDLDRIVVGGLTVATRLGAFIALIFIVAFASVVFWALYTHPKHSDVGVASP